MHDLKLVGFTTDRRGLIFRTAGGARGESYVVPLTDELLAVVAELTAGAAAPGDAPAAVGGVAAADAPATDARPDVDERPRSMLSVRDIQARLRAGESAAQVASEAGVDEEWIERFAPPVRAEQRRVVDQALECHLERARAGHSAVPLRRAVGMAMADKGIAFTIPAFEGAWSSHLIGHDRWAVTFTYRHRGRDHTATWVYDSEAGELTTSDRTASQIGYVPGSAKVREDAGVAVDGIIGDPGATTQIGVAEPAPRPRRRRASTAATGESTTPATASGTKRSATKKAATKKAGPKKAASTRSTKKKAGPKKAASTRSAAKKAATKKAGPKKAASTRSATKKAGPKKATAKKAASTPSVAKKGAAKKAGPKKAASTRSVAKKVAATERSAGKPSTTTAPATEAAGKQSPAGSAPTRASATTRATSAHVVEPTLTSTDGAAVAPTVPVPSRSASARARTPPAGPVPPVPVSTPPAAAQAPPTAIGDDERLRIRSRRAAARPVRTARPAPDARGIAHRPGEVDLAEVPLAPSPPRPPDGRTGNGRSPAVRPPDLERVPDAPDLVDTTATDRADARRARAAERNAPTVQFRSGSAVPVRRPDANGAGLPSRRRQLRAR